MVTDKKLAKLNKAIDGLKLDGFFRAYQKGFDGAKEPIRILDPFWDNQFNGYIVLSSALSPIGVPKINFYVTHYDNLGWKQSNDDPSSYGVLSLSEYDVLYCYPEVTAERFREFLRSTLINKFLKVATWGDPGKSAICL